MMVFAMSTFNRYFGNDPLQTLTKMRDEGIENGNPELIRKLRESFSNSFIELYKNSKEFNDKIGLVEGSIEDKLRKNELSESEVKSLFKWMEENTKHPRWVDIDGVSYDEAYVKILHTSKNIDEFKEKYLELQQKYAVDFNNINASQKKSQEAKNEETFTPIQGESQNKETYKDNNIRNELVENLLKNRFDKKKQLELLFGTKFDNGKSYLDLIV
ncbi:MAG: hypothetical protein J1E31_04435 [Helicobacter sp.]|nr:hypothetical protein [Helicobacter sp.]